MAHLRGRPLLEWVTNALRTHIEKTAISAPLGSGASKFAREKGLEVVSDQIPEAKSPLAGICAGMDWAHSVGAERIVTLPCDVPLISANLVGRLLAAPGNAVLKSGSGYESICAIWQTRHVQDLSHQLRKSRHARILELLMSLGAQEIECADSMELRNINTQSDLREAEKFLSTSSF